MDSYSDIIHYHGCVSSWMNVGTHSHGPTLGWWPVFHPLTYNGMSYILQTMTMVDDSHPPCLDYSTIWMEYYSMLSLL